MGRLGVGSGVGVAIGSVGVTTGRLGVGIGSEGVAGILGVGTGSVGTGDDPVGAGVADPLGVGAGDRVTLLGRSLDASCVISGDSGASACGLSAR